MMRMIGVLAAAALSCRSVEDRPACNSSADCAAGQYCAHTADGNVCWADAVAPAVSNVSVACVPPATPCLRDGMLHVVAEVTDDHEVLGATVSLDLAPAPAVPMTRSGASWVADVQLRNYPFDAFARSVVATVIARDGARNESAPVAGAPVSVTRMRWDPVVIDSTTGFTPTVPAVTQDGTVIVGGSSGKLYFIAPDGTEAHAAVQVAGGQITAAPAVGDLAIWVGSEDSFVYGVNVNGMGLLANVGVNATGSVKGSLAVLPDTTKEWGFATSSNGRVATASTVELERTTSGVTDTFTVGPVLRTDRTVCGATSAALATVRCYAFDGVALTLDPPAPGVGVNVSTPLAVDAADNIWSVSQDAKLHKTAPVLSTTLVATLSESPVDSPVILASGDVVVGDQRGTLVRVTVSNGTIAWSKKLNGDPGTNEALLAPLVLSGGSATLLVPTKTGVLYALDDSGNEVWRTALATGAELRAGNIHTPAGQSGQVLSTAYFSATNGRLHAVIVDGQLDASAPWPKAFHDPRNTNRAGPQP